LRKGPTAEVFTRDNLSSRPLAACCGSSRWGASELHDDDDSRAVTVLTDDERPFVIYGDHERKMRGANDRHAR
jgi:manganese/iron transport system ATP-binding protein